MVSVCSYITGSVGILLAVVGAILLGLNVTEKIIENEVNDEMVISESSKMYSTWLDPPPPIYMQYYMFNVTNPEEVVNGNKPNVTEMGPYTYRLYQPRFDVTFYENDTVSYRFNHTLVFQRNMSAGDENDMITALNVPLVTIDSMIKGIKIPPLIMTGIKLLIEALGDAHLFKKLTVNELLFGYTDPLFDLITKINNLLPGTGIAIPAKFGIFYGYNNTDDGIYLIHSGANNLSETNKIIKWNGNDSLSYWTTVYGNMINGTDGTFFYHGVDKNHSLSLYTTDVCRSLALNFEKETSVRGIKTLRFHMTEFAFANHTINPDNIAYCVPDESNCFGSGVLNIAPCKQNAPVLLSSPHFYMGDEKYIKAVNGINPSKDLHETILDVEPFSGSVFQAKKRLQINVHVQNSSLFPDLQNIIPSIVFPVLWLNESVYVDEGSANEVSGLFVLMAFVKSIPFIILAIGIIILASLGGFLLLKKRKEKIYAPLINDEAAIENSADYGAISKAREPTA